MVLLILLVLALFVLQTLLPNRFRERRHPQGGSTLAYALGPRDDWPPLTRLGGRAERALENMKEALPVFLALALLNLIVQTAAGLAVTGATVFLVARIVYVPAYLSGIPVVRTLVWAVGVAGLVMMLIPLLSKI